MSIEKNALTPALSRGAGEGEPSRKARVKVFHLSLVRTGEVAQSAGEGLIRVWLCTQE